MYIVCDIEYMVHGTSYGVSQKRTSYNEPLITRIPYRNSHMELEGLLHIGNRKAGLG